MHSSAARASGARQLFNVARRSDSLRSGRLATLKSPYRSMCLAMQETGPVISLLVLLGVVLGNFGFTFCFQTV